MNCQEFQSLIPGFIKDSLSKDYYEGFVHHAKTCTNCFDELEIHYMIQIGLERIESDAINSFDIQGELKNRLSYYEHKADSIFLHDIYKKIVFTIAEGCTVVVLVLQILKWLGLM